MIFIVQMVANALVLSAALPSGAPVLAVEFVAVALSKAVKILRATRSSVRRDRACSPDIEKFMCLSLFTCTRSEAVAVVVRIEVVFAAVVSPIFVIGGAPSATKLLSSRCCRLADAVEPLDNNNGVVCS